MPGGARGHNGRTKPGVLTPNQAAGHHLAQYEVCAGRGEVGKSFSHLSLALTLAPTLGPRYEATYLALLEQWSARVEASQGLPQALTLFEVAQHRYPDSPDIHHLLANTLFSVVPLVSMAQQAWRLMFRECLGDRSVTYCEEVVPLLLAVDQGVKPSLLWDVCTADTAGLLALLNTARAKGLLTSRLVLVELELDVFIAHVAATCRTLSSICGANPTWLIDITGQTPKVASSDNHQMIRTHLTAIATQLGEGGSTEPMDTSEGPSGVLGSATPASAATNTDQIKAVQIKLPEDVNLSTIFGCMLGYPHIYWWEGESAGNSLSGMPLKVFKFTATCSLDNAAVELFSFSIPEALEDDLRPGIEHWGNVINMRCEQAGSFSGAKFQCDPVLCLSVAL